MKFTYTEKRIDIPDDIKQYAEKKISKLDKYFRNEGECFITFSFSRGRYTSEVTVHGGSMYFRVSENSSDIRATIDSAVAAIERQIHKNKTRLAKKLRSGSIDQISASGEEMYGVDTEPEESFELIRTKRFSVKPLTPEEAILQMNLLGHEFFVFKNAEDEESFAVVYKRKDGGYGMIEAD